MPNDGDGLVRAIFSGGDWASDETGSTWASGAAYVDGRLLTGESLAEYVTELPSWSHFLKCISEANGFFSIVREHQDTVWLAVDALRSRPLFYATRGEALLVGDIPDLILENLKDLSLDAVSGGELAIAGFVTGKHTLDKRIHQVPAGEVLRVMRQEDSITFENTTYYSFQPPQQEDISECDALVELQDVFLAAINRLCTYANNRTILVPLSGGLDSRLLCLGLKEIGYPHVTTFTYGVAGNDDSTISRRVSEALSLPWSFVEYKTDAWRAVYGGRLFDGYCRFAERLVSTPIAQDWLAVKSLQDNGVIGSNVVVSPGLLGSFVSGTQFSVAHDRFRSPRECVDLRKMIWQSYYGLAPLRVVARALSVHVEQLRAGIHARLDAEVEGLVGKASSCTLSAFQAWSWKYYQANFLINSVRAYEFFGLDWWVPLADRAFVDFWRTVPKEGLLGQSLYLRFLELMQKRLGVDIPLHSHVSERMSCRAQAKDKLILWMRQSRFGNLGLAAWRTSKKVHERQYASHPLAWYGVVDFPTFRALLKSGGNINTIIALRQISRRVEQAKDNSGWQGW